MKRKLHPPSTAGSGSERQECCFTAQTNGTNFPPPRLVAGKVKVSGVTAEQITLKFGDDGSDQFATLSGMGAFFDATTERIFEESGKGMLANL